MINTDGLLLDLPSDYMAPVTKRYTVDETAPTLIMCFDRATGESWSTFHSAKEIAAPLKRIHKNKTIKEIDVRIKPLQLSGPKNHRAIYDRLYDAFHSGEYLEGHSLGRYMCNIISRRVNTLPEMIASLRFELFIENLLLELSQEHEVTTVAGLHKWMWALGKTTKSFEGFARGFYEALLSDFRESFQKD